MLRETEPTDSSALPCQNNLSTVCVLMESGNALGKLGQQAAADLLAEVWVDRVVEEVAGYRDDVHALTLNLRKTSDHYCKNLFCCSQNVGESQ